MEALGKELRVLFSSRVSLLDGGFSLFMGNKEFENHCCTEQE